MSTGEHTDQGSGKSTQTADVVIVGAGLMGCSIAFSLAKRKAGKIVVLEKKMVGAGATGKSSGVLRCHYGIPVLAHMALRSLETYQHASELFGVDLGYKQVGYLVGVGAENVPALRSNIGMLQSLGVTTYELTPQEVEKTYPVISTDGLAGFAYEPEGGYADPSQTAQFYAAKARELGVEIRQGHTVRTFMTSKDGSSVLGVETDKETILAKTVIVASGVWTRPLFAQLGIDVPVRPQLERILFIHPHVSLDAVPVLSDLVHLQYTRPESNGYLLIGNSDHTHPEFVDPDDYERKIDSAYVDTAVDKVLQRFPTFEQASLVTGYTGAYEVTPDYNPIIDKSDVDGLYICTGFSGHGFKLTPVVGELVSDLVLLGGSTDEKVNLSSFRLSRFSEGDLLVSEYRYQGAGQLR